MFGSGHTEKIFRIKELSKFMCDSCQMKKKERKTEIRRNQLPKLLTVYESVTKNQNIVYRQRICIHLTILYYSLGFRLIKIRQNYRSSCSSYNTLQERILLILLKQQQKRKKIIISTSSRNLEKKTIEKIHSSPNNDSVQVLFVCKPKCIIGQTFNIYRSPCGNQMEFPSELAAIR